MTAKKQKHKSTLASQEEKAALLASLKQTMHDLGRLPWLIFAPVIGYVSAHYAKIPEERKSHLQNILDEIKAWGSEGVWKLKDWFKGMIAPQDNKNNKWAPKKESSRADKLKNATTAVAEKAKETTQKAADAAKKPAAKRPSRKPAPKKAKTTAAKKPAAPKKTPAATKKPAVSSSRKPAAPKKTTPATTRKTKTTTAARKPAVKKS